MNRITGLLVAMVLLAGCGSPAEKTELPVVTVSILPQEYFVKQIAGDRVKINVMIPPGASPATYEPTPMQLASLSESNLYLQMGYTGFEMAWLDKMVSTNASMSVANLSEGVDLIHEKSAHDHSQHGHHHGGIDPHVWMSPRNVKVIAANINDALAAAFPADAELFQKNLEQFHQEIDSLDAWIQSELTGLSSRSFFIYHPALSYFSRDYGLIQYPMELGGKEPSPSHLKHLVDLGSEENIGVIFLQMQFDQKNAEALANEIDAEIVQINPLDPEWKKSMRLITNKLKENLQ